MPAQKFPMLSGNVTFQPGYYYYYYYYYFEGFFFFFLFFLSFGQLELKVNVSL